MTPRDYKAIAKSVEAARRRITMGKQPSPDKAIEELTRDLCAVLSRDSDTFRADIFLRSCGYAYERACTDF